MLEASKIATGQGMFLAHSKETVLSSYLTNGASIHFAYHSGQTLLYTLFENSGFSPRLWGAGATINEFFYSFIHVVKH
jgi:hypothetical protein